MALMDFELSDIGGVFTSLREAITGEKIKDPAEMAKIDYQLQKLEQASKDGQIVINKIEAAHKSIFVAGWRPFIGWTAGVALSYSYVAQPLLWWIMKLIIAFSDKAYTPEQIDAMKPMVLDTTMLFNLVLAMLGMAGMRTYEKLKKVSREK